MTAEQRFWDKVQKTEGCWIWTAYLDLAGYGRFSASGRVVYAHRYSWESVNGQIPAGLVIDHKCHTRACVNPGHMHVVTRKQNIENLAGANRNNSTSHVRGVSWSKSVRKWHVYARHSSKTIHGGYFDSLAEAERAAVALRNRIFTNNLADPREKSA